MTTDRPCTDHAGTFLQGQLWQRQVRSELCTGFARAEDSFEQSLGCGGRGERLGAQVTGAAQREKLLHGNIAGLLSAIEQISETTSEKTFAGQR